MSALEVDNLVVEYRSRKWFTEKSYLAVDGVSLRVERGRTIGLVGQSGSGKTTIARAVLGLVKPVSGSIRIAGVDTTGRVAGSVAAIRGKVQAVFQDPSSSLDPLFNVEQLVLEPSPSAGRHRAEELLDLVGMDPSYLTRRPHQLSGGQRQRVAIARALASEPDLIVCDEPVSSLDVSTQAQILLLLRQLQKRTQVALLFIGHDLGVMRYVSDDLVVLNNGVMEESGPTEMVCDHPQSKYTRQLILASPVPDPAIQTGRRLLRQSVTNKGADCSYLTTKVNPR